jgi:hypothetical protein
MKLAREYTERVEEVRISETMRMNETAAEVTGLWDAGPGLIVIKRSQLRRRESFAATLLHEVAHAASGGDHGSLVFEEALTSLLGLFGAASLTDDMRAPKRASR